MTKSEIRQTLDRMVEGYIKDAAKWLELGLSYESEIEEAQGVIRSALMLGVLDEDDWRECMKMLVWFNSTTPIEDR